MIRRIAIVLAALFVLGGCEPRPAPRRRAKSHKVQKAPKKKPPKKLTHQKHEHGHMHPHGSGEHHHHPHPHPHLGGDDGHHHPY